MPNLVRLDNNKAIGVITPEQLAFLIAQLEEDHEEDRDYYIDRETIELLADNGADPELLAMLEKAIGDDEEMDIAWE